MGKTITSRIAQRLKACDKIQQENIDTLKKLKIEASQKFDGTNRHIRDLAKQLEKTPGNKMLQKEYAGTVNARQMFYAAYQLNENLLKQEEG